MPKSLLQSVIAFIENPQTSSYEMDDALDECRECLAILEMRSRGTVPTDRGPRQILQVPEAGQAAIEVRRALGHLELGRKPEALGHLQAALRLVNHWL